VSNFGTENAKRVVNGRRMASWYTLGKRPYYKWAEVHRTNVMRRLFRLRSRETSAEEELEAAEEIKEEAKRIEGMMRFLRFRESQTLILRFGLDGERPLTLDEIGKAFQITRERVRHIEAVAIFKLRRIFNGRSNGLR
jgi:DNA-directed RNA polymerase specialized sigma subunit